MSSYRLISPRVSVYAYASLSIKENAERRLANKKYCRRYIAAGMLLYLFIPPCQIVLGSCYSLFPFQTFSNVSEQLECVMFHTHA